MSTVHPRACGERAPAPVSQIAWARFIPAPAGSGTRLYSQPCRRSVHPRACGERLTWEPINGLISGSSPRLRGAGKPPSGCVLLPRFIPAPAGSGLTPNGSARSGTGSSPRLRGAGILQGLGMLQQRFIPAPAGSGSSSVVNPESSSGSSPRLRGAVRRADPRRAQVRFIPAPAGNGARVEPASRPAPVHPRACGERGASLSLAAALRGSSPRLRGTAAA